MGKQLNTEKGVTLVELLAAIVLASLVMVLVYSVLMTSTKQYNYQLEKSNQLTDISYALKIITKDIRKTEKPQIVNESEIDLNGIKYSFNNNMITRNGVAIANSIKGFRVEGNSVKWIIEIKSSDPKGVEKTEKTEIYLRKGDD
ncbi:PilW family protein [Psychrobacillus sp. NPDC058041]|uniref:PilW family protein n=1 Tax=Psychrobacillus sp. NPDC058041 TaxID=3346310 RepID=UPI0036DDA566